MSRGIYLYCVKCGAIAPFLRNGTSYCEEHSNEQVPKNDRVEMKEAEYDRKD